MGTKINIKIDFPIAFPIIPSFVLLDIDVVVVVLVVLVPFYYASEENVYLERNETVLSRIWTLWSKENERLKYRKMSGCLENGKFTCSFHNLKKHSDIVIITILRGIIIVHRSTMYYERLKIMVECSLLCSIVWYCIGKRRLMMPYIAVYCISCRS